MKVLRKFNGDLMQWLRGFYYVALTGSLSAASKHMGINRAAVRHHLVKLEEELGCSLFDRSVDPMKLTEEGKNYYMELRPYLMSLMIFLKIY